MLSNGYHRQHRSLLQTSKIPKMPKQSISGTLSPETTTTTSSGYSTGGSSVSTTINQSLKKSSSSSSSTACKQYHQQEQEQEHKTKSKGFHNLLTKLKNLLLPTKSKQINSKTMRSTASRQISSTNILRRYRQQSPIYNVLPTSSSSLEKTNKVSLPFTYYYNSPIRQSRANFEKIAAWLNHTEKVSEPELDSSNLSFIDTSQQQSASSSSGDIDNQGITVIMKKAPNNIKPPKRSSSLVTRITRPIIQQQQQQQTQKTVSPTSSFSSSILTKGMSERITPPVPPQKSTHHLSKSNRHRTIDFSRRRTVGSTNEHKSNKENFLQKTTGKSPENIYQFSPLSTNEYYIPSSKQTTGPKKYYFHSNPTTTTTTAKQTNEDLLNNSYGLTLLNQKQPIQQKHSTGTVLMISQVPNQIPLQKTFTPRTSIQASSTLDSLDDLLCDREVESYFYPTSSSQSEHIYMNVENPLSLSYIHGTLC